MEITKEMFKKCQGEMKVSKALRKTMDEHQIDMIKARISNSMLSEISKYINFEEIDNGDTVTYRMWLFIVDETKEGGEE